jgi:hypothetical protein
MTKVTIVAAAAAVLAASSVALMLGRGASASPEQTRVIDRTMRCATGFQGGLRLVTLQASSRAANAGYVWALTNVQPTGRIATLGQSGLELSPFCRPVRTSVSFSARGLQGSLASPFDDRWDCGAPRTVLLRVRAVFRSNAPALRRGEPWGFPILYAHRPVREGSLVVRAPSGKTLAIARLLPTGKVQVLTSDACFPD